MQAILTEEEYKEYLGLKASKVVSLEELQTELNRRLVAAGRRGNALANPNGFLHDLCAIVQHLPDIAKELAEKK